MAENRQLGRDIADMKRQAVGAPLELERSFRITRRGSDFFLRQGIVIGIMILSGDLIVIGIMIVSGDLVYCCHHYHQ